MAIPPAAVRVKVIYPAAGGITSYWPGKKINMITMSVDIQLLPSEI